MSTVFRDYFTGIARSLTGTRRFMPVMMLLMLLTLPLLAVSCSDPEPQTLEVMVADLMDQNEYEAALEILAEADDDPAKIGALRIQVHLTYANYLMQADHLAMGARMPTALRHFRRVAELDPGNSQAQARIELIEGIYEQMGREIPEGVAE